MTDKCPECGSTDLRRDSEGTCCAHCGLVIEEQDFTEQTIYTVYGNPDGDIPSAPMPELAEWINRQRHLIDVLARKGTLNLKLAPKLKEQIGRLCSVCREPVEKEAKLDLCPEHMANWKREKTRMRVKAWRERQKKANVTGT